MSRNNSNRFSASESDQNPNTDPPKVNNSVNSLQNFLSNQSAYSVPTEMVDLPSGGKYYSAESGMQNIDKIEIKHLTVKEEDILSNPDFISRGIALEKLLDSIIVDKNIDHNNLLSGDRNALLVGARIAGYGSDYRVTMRCDSCKKDTMFSFDLSKMKAKHLDLDSEEIEQKDGLFHFRLPKTQIMVGIRVLSTEDEAFLQKQKEQKRSLNLETIETLDFLRSVIVTAGGETDQGLINQFVELMPAIDSRKIKNTYSKIVPGIDFNQEVICQECNASQRREMPFSANFFWPDV